MLCVRSCLKIKFCNKYRQVLISCATVSFHAAGNVGTRLIINIWSYRTESRCPLPLNLAHILLAHCLL